MGRVTVLGSVNMDVVAMAPRLPRIGETIAGSGARLLPGGKGANQAVAAVRMGQPVSLVARVGADGFGDTLKTFLQAQGIEASRLRVDPGAPTGVAIVMVQDDGDNAILVVAGANERLTLDDALDDLGGAGDVLVAQLEVPEAVVAAAFACARARRVRTVLNAAPAGYVSGELLVDTDVLIVNETELETLSGHRVLDLKRAESAARVLRRRSDQVVVVTLGARGCLALNGDKVVRVAARLATVVDTTGAGDCFVGVLAAELAEGSTVDRALESASAAASLCVEREGAAVAMPTRADVEASLGLPGRAARQVGNLDHDQA